MKVASINITQDKCQKKKSKGMGKLLRHKAQTNEQYQIGKKGLIAI